MPALPDGVPAGARPNRVRQDYTFWVLGAERGVLRDAYHTFLRLRWTASLLLIGVGLLISNLAFTLVYWIVGGVDGGAVTFFDMFSFSMQTLATIGYGVMHPKSHAAEVVMIVEAIFGIIVVALATGLVFTKFSRATARMGFSKNAVIAQHEGKPTLMFRCGNRRSNTIVEAQIHVSVALITMTSEGRPFYKITDLKLVRDRMQGLRRGWQVMHVIDESSPFWGLTQVDLEKREAELEISLTGLDDVSMSTVHSIHSYSDKEIRFGHRLADTITTLPSGDLVLDLTKFDVIEPDPRVSVAA